MALVHQLCDLVKIEQRIVAELEDSPLLVHGSTGQSRPNPLLGEARQTRNEIRQIIDSLGLLLPSKHEGTKVGKSGDIERLKRRPITGEEVLEHLHGFTYEDSEEIHS